MSGSGHLRGIGVGLVVALLAGAAAVAIRRPPATPPAATTPTARAPGTAATPPPTATTSATAGTPGAPPGPLRAVAFADDAHGLVGGLGFILTTADGGATWTGAWRGAGSVSSFAAAGGAAWAVTDRSLLRSTDGGATWQAAAEPGGRRSCLVDPGSDCITSVAFASPEVGLAVAAPPPFVGTGPEAVVRSPDGRWLYAANISGTVSAFDLKSGRAAWFVRVGAAPSGIAISPDGRTLYVADQNGAELAVVDVARRAVAARVPVVKNPCGVAVGPRGRRVFVLSAGGTPGISVVDAASHRVLATLPVGNGCALALGPQGHELYVPGQGQVLVVDTATGAVARRVPIPRGAWAAAPSPDGRRLYVTLPVAQRVDVLSAATGHVLASVPVHGLPYAVAVAPGGGQAYVAVSSSPPTLDVIDAATSRVVRSVPLGADDGGFSIFSLTVAGGRVYVPGVGGGVGVYDPARGGLAHLATGGVAATDALGLRIPAAGSLYRTDDGGGSWSRLPGPPGVQTACLVSPTVGYAAAGASVYATGDGGRTWRRIWQAPLQGSPGRRPRPTADLQCRGRRLWDLLVGFGAAMGHAGYIAFGSTDAGRTWQPLLEENYTHPGARGVDAPEGPGSYPGPFTLTASGGPVWAGQTPPALQSAIQVGQGPGVRARPLPRRGNLEAVLSLSFPTTARGWAVTSGDRLWATGDGGRTWRLVLTGPAPPRP